MVLVSTCATNAAEPGVARPPATAGDAQKRRRSRAASTPLALLRATTRHAADGMSTKPAARSAPNHLAARREQACAPSVAALSRARRLGMGKLRARVRDTPACVDPGALYASNGRRAAMLSEARGAACAALLSLPARAARKTQNAGELSPPAHFCSRAAPRPRALFQTRYNDRGLAFACVRVTSSTARS